MSDIVSQLWNYCHTLRHDGVDYGDYIEQLTYLLFLKMADEQGVTLPANLSWQQLRYAPESASMDIYERYLHILSVQPGILGDIYADAENRLSNGRNLTHLVTLIDNNKWSDLGIDVQAAAFEGLLEKAASEGKRGAGQYFTPRPLVECMVRLIRPDPLESKSFKLNDPACGTAGFIAAAYDWYISHQVDNLSEADSRRIRESSYYGQELVKRPRRLALMNLYLRGLSPEYTFGRRYLRRCGSYAIRCRPNQPAVWDTRVWASARRKRVLCPNGEQTTEFYPTCRVKSEAWRPNGDGFAR